MALPQTKSWPSLNAANQASPHTILWRCLTSVSQSPLAVDCRECQEAAVADSLTCPSPSRVETSQKLRCLGCAPGHLNPTFPSLLISSFLQSSVPCLPSLHSPLPSEMPSSEQFLLSLLFHLIFETMLWFLYQVKQFFTLWCAPPQPSLPITSLHIPIVLSSVCLVLTSNRCLLQLSPSFLCLLP